MTPPPVTRASNHTGPGTISIARLRHDPSVGGFSRRGLPSYLVHQVEGSTIATRGLTDAVRAPLRSSHPGDRGFVSAFLHGHQGPAP